MIRFHYFDHGEIQDHTMLDLVELFVNIYYIFTNI